MLGADARNAQTYLAGAMLDNGARIVEIHADHIVLERQKERAALYVQGSSRAGDRAENLNRLLTVGGIAQELPRETLYSVDPVTDFIRAVPSYNPDNTVAGFRVYPGTQRSVFSAWGLSPGDVITSLDGMALVDSDQVTETLSALAEGAALKASVRRGEETISIWLDGAQIQKVNEARLGSRLALQPQQP